MIEARNLTKHFSIAANSPITVLKNISFSIEANTWTSLMGASGSGKSTLLTILAGLDVPSEGDVIVNGLKLSALGEDARTQFRARNMGFVFQSFRLLPHLTAFENICVPLEILGDPASAQKAKTLLDRVGLAHRMNNLPSQLSGGEQQRVAIARAFVARPKILFADEPTGNLDSKNGEAVLGLMKELHEEHGSTLVVVTHEPTVAAFGGRQIHLKDGSLCG